METHLEIYPENHLDIHCEIYPETHPEIYADLHPEYQEHILKLASDWIQRANGGLEIHLAAKSV